MYFYTKTGNTAIAESYEIKQDTMLQEVRIGLNQAGASGTLIVSLDSVQGSAYDVVLLSQSMALVTSLVWQPDESIPLVDGDKVIVTWANAGSAIYGLEVIIGQEE